MGIGTSKGAYFETEFDHGTDAFRIDMDKNVEIPKSTGDLLDVDPGKMQMDMAIGSDPKNIYDGHGNIVDYDLKLPTMKEFQDRILEHKEFLPYKELPLIYQQSMKDNKIELDDRRFLRDPTETLGVTELFKEYREDKPGPNELTRIEEEGIKKDEALANADDFELNPNQWFGDNNSSVINADRLSNFSMDLEDFKNNNPTKSLTTRH